MYILTVTISIMVTDKANITITIKYEVVYGLSITYLELTLAYSKGHHGRMNGVSSNLLSLFFISDKF